MRVDQLGSRRKDGLVAVAIHGWSPFWSTASFQDRCLVHEHTLTLYPRSERWRLTNWAPSDAQRVADALLEARPTLLQEPTAFLAISDACVLLEGLCRIFVPEIVVWWSGLWNDDDLTPAKRKRFVVGEKPGPCRTKTLVAARFYDEEAYEHPGGHAWYPDFNERLLRMD